jgi:hypothetical protein
MISLKFRLLIYSSNTRVKTPPACANATCRRAAVALTVERTAAPAEAVRWWVCRLSHTRTVSSDRTDAQSKPIYRVDDSARASEALSDRERCLDRTALATVLLVTVFRLWRRPRRSDGGSVDRPTPVRYLATGQMLKASRLTA